MNSAYASTSFTRPARSALFPPLQRLATGWLVHRREALARRQLAELPPHLRRDLGLGPALYRPAVESRSFDYNSPTGSPGAYW